VAQTDRHEDVPASSSPNSILDAALEAIITVDAGGTIIYLNPAAEELFALDQETAVGQDLIDLIIPPDLRDSHRSELKRLADGEDDRILGKRLKLEGLRSDGAQFPVELTVTRSAQEPAQYTGFIRDLSAIQEEERQRTRMQELLNKAEELAGTGSFEVDLQTLKVTWSDELFRIHGYQPGEVEPTIALILDQVHPDDQDEIRTRSAAMLDSPYAAVREYRICLPDGTVRYVVGTNIVERDESGEPARLVGTIQDVTEKRLTEQELQAHYALTQTLSDWHSFDEGLVDLLRRLGTAMSWDVASVWVRAERGDSLICRAYWSAPSMDLPGVEKSTREVVIPIGTGVIGRAWERMEPMAIEDIASDSRIAQTPALTAANEAGLRSSLMFPAAHDGEPLAVIAFGAKEPRRLNERLTRTLGSLGQDLGRFLARRRAEIGLRRLSDRELQVLQLAAEGLAAPMFAERLVISPATVKTHFAHTYEKLGVTDRAAAVAEGMRQGLIS
jgi:PAS domain S-box-containing protein